MRPSAFPVISALKQAKGLLPSGQDWAERSLVHPQLLRTNPEFVQWVKKYNIVYVETASAERVMKSTHRTAPSLI
jgi:hypothetical protein